MAVFLSSLAGCEAQDQRPSRITLVGSVSPITDLVARVAGARAEVVGIIPEGVDSHTFEPSPRDVRAISQADVVFVNGLHLETSLIELTKKNLKEGGRLVSLGDRTLGPEGWIYDRSFPAEKKDPNPHLWTNPIYARRFVDLILEALVAADPQGDPTYRDNATRLREAIDRLDSAIRVATGTIPASRRKLLTYHDSFPYFAREYGWTVIGAVQPADFKEPTAREVADLIDQVRTEGVPAIFGSEVYPSTILKTIAAETGARYVADLRDDDLPGEPGDSDHSYIGLMRHDLITIIEALGGDAMAIKAVTYDTGT